MCTSGIGGSITNCEGRGLARWRVSGCSYLAANPGTQDGPGDSGAPANQADAAGPDHGLWGPIGVGLEGVPLSPDQEPTESDNEVPAGTYDPRVDGPRPDT
jgi:hypothetical protein